MSGLYWLAIFLCVSRYESAKEECKKMFMQKMEKHNVTLVLLIEQRTMQSGTQTGRKRNVKDPSHRVSTTSWNLVWWMDDGQSTGLSRRRRQGVEKAGQEDSFSNSVTKKVRR